MVSGTPWNLRPGEVVVRRRYITRALVERYGPTEDCVACFRISQQHSERCRARFDLLCAGEEGPAIRPFVTGGDETMEQEGSESKRQRTVACLPVCSLLICRRHPCEERWCTREKRQTSERLSPHLVKVDNLMSTNR